MFAERPVLVIADVDDPTADLVIGQLHDQQVPVVRVNLADFPQAVTVAARFGAGARLRGELRTSTRTLDLSGVRSVYYRRPSPCRLPEMTDQDSEFAFAQARYGFGGIIAALPDCLYVSHPRRIADAEFKPTQLAAAAALGFTVPPTLITNDPGAARDFAAEVGRIVYKPLRMTRWAGSDGRSQHVWVADADPATFDESIRHTAHMFQARVEKTADVRVTVIGRTVFAVRINGPHLDWRHDYDSLTYAVIDPPGKLASALHRYLDWFGLAFGCFDFGLTPEGNWAFFECNPNGQWGWLEPATGLPFTATVASLLQRGTIDE